MALAALLLSFCGLGTLAMSMPKHYRDVFGTVLMRGRRRVLALVGCAFLAASFLTAVAAFGPSIGVVFWFGVATFAALTTALGLSFGRASTNSSS